MAERYRPFLTDPCPIKKLAKRRGLPGCNNQCESITPELVCPYTDNPDLFAQKDSNLVPTNPSNMFVARNLSEYGVDVPVELPIGLIYKDSEVE